jgi:hypothetical protein
VSVRGQASPKILNWPHILVKKMKQVSGNIICLRDAILRPISQFYSSPLLSPPPSHASIHCSSSRQCISLGGGCRRSSPLSLVQRRIIFHSQNERNDSHSGLVSLLTLPQATPTKSIRRPDLFRSLSEISHEVHLVPVG